jgi:hypothetical protein
MKKCGLIILILFLTVILGLANDELKEKVQLTKKEYLQLVIGAYVWGFNEFDTGINIYPNLIRINIYYDIDRQSVELADSLKKRFELQIPNLIQHIPWAKDYKIDVSVYSEARLKSGY